MNTDKIYAERLASEYAPKTTRKIKALIRLDKWIKKPAFITALTVGTLSALAKRLPPSNHLSYSQNKAKRDTSRYLFLLGWG